VEVEVEVEVLGRGVTLKGTDGVEDILVADGGEIVPDEL